MSTPDVRIATPTEIDQCVATIVLAFSSDPAARWAFADRWYFEVFRARSRVGGKASIRAQLTSLPACAALWIRRALSLRGGMDRGDRERGRGERREGMFGCSANGRVPPCGPHWYGLDWDRPGETGQWLWLGLLRHALASATGRVRLSRGNSARTCRSTEHGFEAWARFQRQLRAITTMCEGRAKPTAAAIEHLRLMMVSGSAPCGERRLCANVGDIPKRAVVDGWSPVRGRTSRVATHSTGSQSRQVRVSTTASRGPRADLARRRCRDRLLELDIDGIGGRRTRHATQVAVT